MDKFKNKQVINIVFTQEILDDIIPKYKNGKIDEILYKYHELSKQSLYLKMSRLGIKTKNKKWTDDEVSILKENYTTKDFDELLTLLPNRTYSAIRTKAEKLGIKKRLYWTEDEIKCLEENYSKLPVDDICKLIPNRSRKTIIMKASELCIKNDIFFTEDEINYILENWGNMSDEKIGCALNRNPGGIQNKRLQLGLSRYDIRESSYDLITYLRGQLFNWKQESMKNCNYKCVISGNRFDNIHHIYGFNLIFEEFISTYNVKIYKSILSYTKEELNLITKNFLKIHNKYPLGVCLTKEIHEEFHKIYGYGRNTTDQWNEFKKQYSINN